MPTEFGKTLTIMSGPNGAGKTTFAKENYPELIEKGLFLNADHVAGEIDPGDVNKVAISAGKQFLAELNRRLQHNDSLVIETTLSGKSLLRKIEIAQQQGFTVRLMFLWIRTIELCDFRVKMRVTLGGHNIPFDDIKRRHARGLQNLPTYLNVVDEYEVFQANANPILIFNKNMNSPVQIVNQPLYDELQSIIG